MAIGNVFKKNSLVLNNNKASCQATLFKPFRLTYKIQPYLCVFMQFTLHF